MLGILEGTTDEVVRELRIRVSQSEARAMQRCLDAEGQVIALPTEKLVRSYFDRDGHPLEQAARRREGHVEVRATISDTLTHQVVLEMRRVFGEMLRNRRLLLPRHTLRAALRPNVARELLPGMPLNVEPVVLVSCLQRTFQHPDGWQVSFCRDLSVYRPQPRAPKQRGNRPTGAARLPGVVVSIVVTRGELPDWLEHLSRNAERFDEFTRAMAALPRAEEPRTTAWVH